MGLVRQASASEGRQGSRPQRRRRRPDCQKSLSRGFSSSLFSSDEKLWNTFEDNKIKALTNYLARY